MFQQQIPNNKLRTVFKKNLIIIIIIKFLKLMLSLKLKLKYTYSYSHDSIPLQASSKYRILLLTQFLRIWPMYIVYYIIINYFYIISTK